MLEREWLEADTCGARRVPKNTEAVCLSFEQYEGEKRAPLSGYILFHRRRFGAGIVSHELTHAALHIEGRKRPITMESRQEERICLTVGNLVRQFWQKYYRRQPKVAWLKGMG